MKKIILFVVLCFVLCNAKTEAQFGGGDGLSKATAYEIHNITHLQYLADMVNATSSPNWSSGLFFIVMDDIDDPMTDIIGRVGTTYTSNFEGSFDGNNKRINLAITNSTIHTGLFGVISANAIEIKNIIVYGSVAGAMSVGGIAGMSYIPITNCVNAASIQGTVMVGGILGQLRPDFGSFMANCVNVGRINGTQIVGGIVGSVYNGGPVNTWNITNCINYGYVRGNAWYAGGIIGHSGHLSPQTISNCVNTSVIEWNNSVSCIVGSQNDWPMNIINCWWDKQLCPHDN